MASPTTAGIRKFLIKYFSDAELTTLCFDYFRDVYDEFAEGMPKTEKVQRLIERCVRRETLPELLEALERERPEQYRQRFSTPAAEARNDHAMSQPAVETQTSKASQPASSRGPQGTSDKMGKSRSALTVWDIGCVGLILLVAVALWPTIQNAIAPTPRPTAEVLEFKLSTRATPTLGIDSTRVSEKDGMEMVYVPAGEFLMGSTDSDTSASSDEKPQHRVYLDAFWIDRTEVTNEMFEKFVADSGHKTDAEKAGKGRVLDLASKIGIGKETAGANWREPRGPGSYTGLDQHPVVQVSWDDAKAYCEWAERRLPTEAEWEKAARGTDSLKFPWRNQNIAGDLLNFADRKLKEASWADTSVDDGYKFTAPVGSYPKGASPYRARDMAGNVWEWVADWYGEKYYTSSAAQSPTGPALGQERVMRGGSWDDPQVKVRAAKRLGHIPDFSGADVGFRCAYPP